MSYQLEIVELSLASSSSKDFSETVSYHETRPVIEGTGELCVKARADDKAIWRINRELCVTPATNIPMIKITIDNSINEKALWYFIFFDYS